MLFLSSYLKFPVIFNRFHRDSFEFSAIFEFTELNVFVYEQSYNLIMINFKLQCPMLPQTIKIMLKLKQLELVVDLYSPYTNICLFLHCFILHVSIVTVNACGIIYFRQICILDYDYPNLVHLEMQNSNSATDCSWQGQL